MRFYRHVRVIIYMFNVKPIFDVYFWIYVLWKCQIEMENVCFFMPISKRTCTSSITMYSSSCHCFLPFSLAIAQPSSSSSSSLPSRCWSRVVYVFIYYMSMQIWLYASSQHNESMATQTWWHSIYLTQLNISNHFIFMLFVNLSCHNVCSNFVCASICLCFMFSGCRVTLENDYWQFYILTNK